MTFLSKIQIGQTVSGELRGELHVVVADIDELRHRGHLVCGSCGAEDPNRIGNRYQQNDACNGQLYKLLA